MTTTDTNVDLEVRVDGNKQAEYAKDGRFYIEAKDGIQYTLRLRNNNPFPVKAVITVDGVSVLTGEAAGTESTEAGYILGAHEVQTIHGYRISDKEVAAFKFIAANRGYAQVEKGMSGTTGVIGLRVWKEKEFVVPAPQPIIKEVHHHHDNIYYDPWYPYWYRPSRRYFLSDNICYGTTFQDWPTLDGTTYACCTNNLVQGMAESQAVQSAMQCSTQMSSSLVEENLSANPFDAGSTFGSKVDSLVKEVIFTAGVCLGEINLYYAFKAGLTTLGVDLTKASKVVFPTAFGSKYCKIPSGWPS